MKMACRAFVAGHHRAPTTALAPLRGNTPRTPSTPSTIASTSLVRAVTADTDATAAVEEGTALELFSRPDSAVDQTVLYRQRSRSSVSYSSRQLRAKILHTGPSRPSTRCASVAGDCCAGSDHGCGR